MLFLNLYILHVQRIQVSKEVERRSTVGSLDIVFLMKKRTNDLQLHMHIELTAAMLFQSNDMRVDDCCKAR